MVSRIDVRVSEGVTLQKSIERAIDFFKRNPWAKRALIAHNLLALSSFAFATYNDGIGELRQHRRYYNTRLATDEDEWDVIKRGCNKRRFENALSSVFFPFTIISNMMPLVISSCETDKQ